MDLQLRRFYNTPDDSVGLLYIEGKRECLALEDEYRGIKVMQETRIPAGRYEIVLHRSEKYFARFGHDVLMLVNVPQFSYIYIHPGTTDDDTSGCILVGNSAVLLYDGKSALAGSRLAYFRLYGKVAPVLQRGEKVFIDIIDEEGFL